MNAEQKAIQIYRQRAKTAASPCGCLGAQALPDQPVCDGKNWDQIKRQPACPCAMGSFVDVDGHYYRVSEARTEDGSELSALHFGPVGGPYKFDEYGRPTQAEAAQV